MRIPLIFFLLMRMAFTTVAQNTVPAVYGVQNLKVWNAWKKNPNFRYDWLLIGDSYTQGNFYSGLLRDKLLADGYKDGGPGYCSFGRWGLTEDYSIDGSIDAKQLTFSYNLKQWESIKQNMYGPCNHVKNNAANALITVTAKVPLSTLTLIYERHPGAGKFRYRVNKGAWKIASANSTKQGIGGLVINVASLGNNINVQVQALAAGQIFCGVLGKRDGNVFTMHKVGSSGAQASVFAQNTLWEASTRLLTPKGVIIMFGTNEHGENVPPAVMRANVQNIINKIRNMSPACDIVIMCPVETEYEKEKPRKYKLANYRNMLYQLAVTNKTAFIDHSKAFGHFSQALVDQHIMETDRLHPGPKGGEMIANTIYSVLK